MPQGQLDTPATTIHFILFTQCKLYVNQHEFFMALTDSSSTRDHSKKLFKPRAITSMHQTTFFSYMPGLAISSWKNLPQHVIAAIAREKT